MSDKVDKAVSAARLAAREIVEDCIEGVKEAIKHGTDKDEAIYQVADDSCIYTADCYVLAFGLDDSDLENDLGGPPNGQDHITYLASCRLIENLQRRDYEDVVAEED